MAEKTRPAPDFRFNENSEEVRALGEANVLPEAISEQDVDFPFDAQIRNEMGIEKPAYDHYYQGVVVVCLAKRGEAWYAVVSQPDPGYKHHSESCAIVALDHAAAEAVRAAATKILRKRDEVVERERRCQEVLRQHGLDEESIRARRKAVLAAAGLL